MTYASLSNLKNDVFAPFLSSEFESSPLGGFFLAGRESESFDSRQECSFFHPSGQMTALVHFSESPKKKSRRSAQDDRNPTFSLVGIMLIGAIPQNQQLEIEIS
jgi:hypothetical protein